VVGDWILRNWNERRCCWGGLEGDDVSTLRHKKGYQILQICNEKSTFGGERFGNRINFSHYNGPGRVKLGLGLGLGCEILGWYQIKLSFFCVDKSVTICSTNSQIQVLHTSNYTCVTFNGYCFPLRAPSEDNIPRLRQHRTYSISPVNSSKVFPLVSGMNKVEKIPKNLN